MNYMLHPTLWRTCRVLANPVRLRLLQAVCRLPGSSVSDLQDVCRLPQSSASHHLRQLQARGLLKATADGRYLRYAPVTDPTVSHADAVQAAVLAALKRDGPVTAISQTLKGLTHARRLAIVRRLHRGPTTPEALVSACRISRPAVYRHLARLQKSGWVEVDGDDTWRLPGNLQPLANDLLAVACAV